MFTWDFDIYFQLAMKYWFQFYFCICKEYLYLIFKIYQSKTTCWYYFKPQLENLEYKKYLI